MCRRRRLPPLRSSHAARDGKLRTPTTTGDPPRERTECRVARTAVIARQNRFAEFLSALGEEQLPLGSFFSSLETRLMEVLERARFAPRIFNKNDS